MKRDGHQARITGGRDGLWLEITADEPMVWADPGATYYHAAGCELLPPESCELPLSEARERGLEPCPVCQDPADA